MAIPNQTPYNIFTANGISTVFPYEFYLLNSFDLTVSINGAELTSGFTISGIGNVDGGEVTFLTPPANGSVILLERVVPTYRLTEYQDNGDLLAETVNKDFDRLWMAIQQAFIYLGLALTRPLLGGPFNAHGYRIENLGNPVNPQDAATKNYVDSTSATNLNRVLRVPESFVNQIPHAALRAESLLGFDSLAQPKPIFSWTDTADLALKLAGPNGGSYVYEGNSPISYILPESIFKYMTLQDIDSIRNNLGIEVDVDYALQEAISNGVNHLIYPAVKGIYIHGSSNKLPSGFNIVAQASRRPYTVSSDVSFYNCGVVIRMKEGDSGIFELSGRNTFSGVIFDGRSKTVGMMNATSQVSGCRFEMCGSYRWSNGLGRTTSYVATVYARGCNFSGNSDGIRNLIDSSVIDSVTNNNSERGVAQLTGANNSSFIRVRNEWNGKSNYYSYGGKQNIISGELCDRAGLAGIVAAGGGNWLLSNTVVRRSGRFAVATSEDDTHFRVEDSGSWIYMSNVTTHTGADDDGGGRVSPSYTLRRGGSSTNTGFIASGSDLGGFTVSFISEVVGGRQAITGCFGYQDSVNTGISQKGNGRSYIGPVFSGNFNAGSTITYTHSQPPMVQFQVGVKRTLEIEVRDTGTGGYENFSIPAMCTYELGGVSLSLNSIDQKSFPANRWGVASSSPTGVTVSAAISSGGETVTITLTGLDTRNRQIKSYWS